MRLVRGWLGGTSAAILTLVMMSCANGIDSGVGETEGGVDVPDAVRRDVNNVIPEQDSSTESDGDTGTKPGTDSSVCSRAVVINELKTDGPDADDEFVELYNPSTCAVALGGWEIKYKSGGGGAGPAGYKFPAGDSIASKAYVLVASASFSGSKDATLVTGMSGSDGQVGLLDDKGVVVDAVAYGSVTAGPYRESKSAPKPASGESIGRTADGVDTDDNKADFKTFATPTPRAPN